MPRLLPQIDVDTIEPISERQVIVALLRDLPADCVILHSWETLILERTGGGKGIARLVQGECDAVVIWPDKGVLVLEVKGGGVDVDSRTGQWTSRDRYGNTHKIKDPFEQARRNMHTLIEKVATEIGRPKQKLGFNFGYAVVLPSKRAEGSLPAKIDPAILCDGSGLASMGTFIERALELWRRKIDPSARTVKFSSIVSAILPTMRLVPSLAGRMDAEGHALHRMTEDQARFLDYVRAQSRARVWGAAGSGKTLLAVQRARRFATNEMRTLFLCYNKSLAVWLREATANDHTPFEICTFHELCGNVTRAAGNSFEAPRDYQEADEFWKSGTPELLLENFESSGIEYDALVVDEGQDFRADWWDALSCVISDDSPVYVFFDENQNLFHADGRDALKEWLPQRFDLPTNCRNTQSIAGWCSNIVAIDATVNEQAPVGLAVSQEFIEEGEKRKTYIEELVKKWVVDEKISPSRIAILSPYRAEKTCLSEVSRIGSVKLVSSVEDWSDGKGLLMTTIRSFKGLEADAIVMIDLPEPDSTPAFSSADFYVGCSRAKTVLYLVAKEAFEKDYSQNL